MKFAFYVSGKAGRLLGFLQKATADDVNGISLVVSDAPATLELKSILSENGIELVEHPYESITGSCRAERNRLLSDLLLSDLKNHNIDYCISFGSHILSGELLKVYEKRLFNFHPAILPMYKGVRAIDQAVADGKALLIGNTVHFIDEGVDTGKILMQSVIPIRAFTKRGCDYNIVLDLQIEMLMQLLKVLRNGLLVVEGEDVYIKGANYTKSGIYPSVDFT